MTFLLNYVILPPKGGIIMPTLNVWVREKDDSPKTPEQIAAQKHKDDFAFALVSGYLCGYFNCICEHKMQPNKSELVHSTKTYFYNLIPVMDPFIVNRAINEYLEFMTTDPNPFANEE